LIVIRLPASSVSAAHAIACPASTVWLTVAEVAEAIVQAVDFTSPAPVCSRLVTPM